VLEGGSSLCTLSDVDGAGDVSATPDGCWQGNVYGTYLHGVFDSTACAGALVRALFEAKGLDATNARAVDMRAYKEEQYDKLAQTVRDNMDMELIYRILEEGV
jgi:adenosylcobyric acid synthase